MGVKIINSVIDPTTVREGVCVSKIALMYVLIKSREKTQLMIVNLYENIVTGIFVKYQLPQETLCICKNYEEGKLDESDLEKTNEKNHGTLKK